jgi:heat-inducible transcriptional repressor
MKKNIILENLIQIYLGKLNPVSSAELKRESDLPFSPSTIRNYLQQLEQEGLVIRVHISSGSIPSKKALREYWHKFAYQCQYF